MPLLSSLVGNDTIATESWTDFHKKHRSRLTYVGSNANKRRATFNRTSNRRSSVGGPAAGAGGSAIYGGAGGTSSSIASPGNRRGSLS